MPPNIRYASFSYPFQTTKNFQNASKYSKPKGIICATFVLVFSISFIEQKIFEMPQNTLNIQPWNRLHKLINIESQHLWSFLVLIGKKHAYQ